MPDYVMYLSVTFAFLAWIWHIWGEIRERQEEDYRAALSLLMTEMPESMAVALLAENAKGKRSPSSSPKA